MSIFEYELTSSLNGQPMVGKEIEILSTLFMCPLEMRDVMINFIEKTTIETIKDKKTYRGTKLFKWYMDNPIVIFNNYEYDSWPLIDFYTENEEMITIYRNLRLAPFFEELEQVLKKINTSDLKSIVLRKRNPARFYANWLLKKKPAQLELTFEELILLFNAQNRLYTSIPMLENRIIKNCNSELLSSANLVVRYEKDQERLTKKLHFSITEITS